MNKTIINGKLIESKVHKSMAPSNCDTIPAFKTD